MILTCDNQRAALINHYLNSPVMKILSITLTLAQLKELCEKRITDILLLKGTAMLRIKVKIPE